jgi:hypothetical protein
MGQGSPGQGDIVWKLSILLSLVIKITSSGINVFFIQKERLVSSLKTKSIPPSGARALRNMRPLA